MNWERKKKLIYTYQLHKKNHPKRFSLQKIFSQEIFISTTSMLEVGTSIGLHWKVKHSDQSEDVSYNALSGAITPAIAGPFTPAPAATFTTAMSTPVAAVTSTPVAAATSMPEAVTTSGAFTPAVPANTGQYLKSPQRGKSRL